MEWNLSRKNLNISISSDSIYDSIAYDAELDCQSWKQSKAEEPTNHKVQNEALWLVYSSASASIQLQQSSFQ